MPMRIALALAAALLLAACGTDSGRATDPAGSPSSTPVPTEVPVASGPVHTRGLVTVMDTGSPQLCLGPVAESYPPQCGGPPLVGWDWADHHGAFEHVGEIRWGEFAVSGTFDGTTFTVTDAVPAALYDAMAQDPGPTPTPAVSMTQEQLQSIAEELGRELAGAQGAYAADGHVVVDVTYDDGSLQAWADDTYGDDVVLIWSALVPPEG